MSKRKQKLEEVGVGKVADYELEGEYTGATIMDVKRRGTRITAKTSTAERNRNYFAAPEFKSFQDLILNTLSEKLSLPLLPQSQDIALEISELILVEIAEYLKPTKKSVSRVSLKDLAEKKENLQDDLIDYIQDWLTVNQSKIESNQVDLMKALLDYELFAMDLILFLASKIPIKEEEQEELYQKLLDFLDSKTISIDFNDEEIVLEIVYFLKDSQQKKLDLFESLTRVQFIYQRYGKDGFPWQLDVVSEIAEKYFKRSDLSKILRRGIKEKTPCRINGCGGMESTVYLLEVRSTDEGKTEKRYCVRCGNKRK